MRRWPPLGKFLLVISLLIVSLLSTSLLIPIVVFAIGMMLLIRSTRLRFPRVISLALVEGVLIFLIGALIIALVTKGGAVLVSFQVLGLQMSITEEGLQRGLQVFLRALAGVAVMLFFATSTPIPHFASALRQLKVPSYLAELVILVYRYSFLLFEQLQVLYTAAQCRVGFRGAKNKMRTTAQLAVGLFIRSMEVADRSQIALYCRNFKGDFPSFRPPARMTAAWALIPVCAFMALYSLNYWIMASANFGW